MRPKIDKYVVMYIIKKNQKWRILSQQIIPFHTMHAMDNKLYIKRYIVCHFHFKTEIYL